MKKYIRLFNSLDEAKAANDLISPNVTMIIEGNDQKILSLDTKVADQALEITGTSLENVQISAR